MFTIIMRDNGIDRTYKCNTKYDAIVLFDALTRATRVRIEFWDSQHLEQLYDPR